MKTVVVGLGNRMRGDDGVGPAVIDQLRGRVPPDVHLIENSGDVAELIEAWRGADRALLIDAVIAAEEAGSVHRIDGRLGLPPGWWSASTHLVSLTEAVELSWELHCLPDELTVFAITAATVDRGDCLSPEVGAVVDEVVEWVLADLEEADA